MSQDSTDTGTGGPYRTPDVVTDEVWRPPTFRENYINGCSCSDCPGKLGDDTKCVAACPTNIVRRLTCRWMVRPRLLRQRGGTRAMSGLPPEWRDTNGIKARTKREQDVLRSWSARLPTWARWSTYLGYACYSTGFIGRPVWRW